MFNAKMLELARKLRGIAKTEMSEKLNLSIQTLSEWEQGKTVPKLENLREVANLLKFPVEFFYKETENLDNLNMSFRALTKMKAVDRDKAISSAKMGIILNHWMEQKFNLPTVDLPKFENLSPEECAMQIRRMWNLDECINNTINLLEKHGVRVFSLIEDCKDYDALSTWSNGCPYIFINTTKSAERCRFDAMHELGHLVMHYNRTDRDRTMEDEANRFASEMLMPMSSILKYKNISLNLNSFINIKIQWKVSLSALIYRYNKLGIITEWNNRSLNIQLRKLGYDEKEPKSIERETSTILPKIFKYLKQDNFTIRDLSNELKINTEDLNKLMFNMFSLSVIYGGNEKTQKEKPDLRLI